MLLWATEDLSDDYGIYIGYRTDDSLFLRRLQTYTKILEHLIRELPSAEDAAFVANTETALQHVTSCFAEAAKLFESQSQPEEDRGSPPARLQGSVQPTPQYNWRDRIEGSPAVHIPGLQYLLRRKN